MSYFENYLDFLNSDSPGYGDGIRDDLESFVSEKLTTYDYTSHSSGLLIGQVQSGKTGQMLGIISGAADLGFKFFEETFWSGVDLSELFRNGSARINDNELIDGVVCALTGSPDA